MNAQIDKTKLQLQMIDKKLEKLQTISNRPKALRLYEPRIQKMYASIIGTIIVEHIIFNNLY